VFGIALTYSLLGVLAAKTGALFGSLLGHPIVVSIIALLFIIMGLSMYGFFEIKIPDKLTNRILKNRIDAGYLGAFLSGLVAGIVASPCVGPVLVSILTYVAQSQDVMKGFILLMAFAFGLGQIFIILGTFSHLLSKLPKSGEWMEKVKFLFGTTMIIMALYFIYPVTHSNLFDGLMATALILIATFFGAFERVKKINFESKVWKATMTLVFIFGWVFAIKALLPKHIEEELFLSQKKIKARYNKPEWNRYSIVLLETAKREGLPVIIDFRAEWCLACKELEINTFSDAKVLDLGKRFIWLEFDATKPSPELEELKKAYNIQGLPHVVFIDQKGRWKKDLTLNGFESSELFLIRMEKCLSTFNPRDSEDATN
jgi:thiol:disulfide interchange protein DsbD